MFVSGVVEEWRSVPGHNVAYEVSAAGGLRSCRSRSGIAHIRLLCPYIADDGRRYVVLSDNGIRKIMSVARLVALAFLPQPLLGDCLVRHLNDVPGDDRVENLAWGSVKDNMTDAIRNCRLRPSRGVDHCCAVLDPQRVIAIRHLYKIGKTQRDIASTFGVSLGAIGDIVRGRNWKHLPYDPADVVADSASRRVCGSRHGCAKLTEVLVKELRRRYHDGITQVVLSKMFGVSQAHVSSIVRRETWAHIA